MYYVCIIDVCKRETNRLFRSGILYHSGSNNKFSPTLLLQFSIQIKQFLLFFKQFTVYY